MNPFSNHLVAPLPLKLATGDLIDIQRFRCSFAPWRGQPIADTYGGKSVLDSSGEPVFAELHSSVAAALRGFIGDRKDGFIFRSEKGTPVHQSNFLRRCLHPLLEQLGIEKQGFHGFRRFRVTHLESSTVPPALVKYWTGHASSSDGEAVRSTVTDRYVKMAKDTKFRAEVAERIGLGFELPKAGMAEVVPTVPNSQESEVVVSV